MKRPPLIFLTQPSEGDYVLRIVDEDGAEVTHKVEERQLILLGEKIIPIMARLARGK